MPLTVSMPNRIAVPVTLASQQATVAARTATLEQLRERLESGEPPEKKASRMTEEEQRLVQQALQRNLFSMARQIPMKIKINGKGKQRLWMHTRVFAGCSRKGTAPHLDVEHPFTCRLDYLSGYQVEVTVKKLLKWSTMTAKLNCSNILLGFTYCGCFYSILVHA